MASLPPGLNSQLSGLSTPAATAVSIDMQDRSNRASPAFLKANRDDPMARTEYKEARAALPAAGGRSGSGLAAKTSTTWLPVQNNGEPLLGYAAAAK